MSRLCLHSSLMFIAGGFIVGLRFSDVSISLLSSLALKSPDADLVGLHRMNSLYLL